MTKLNECAKQPFLDNAPEYLGDYASLMQKFAADNKQAIEAVEYISDYYSDYITGGDCIDRTWDDIITLQMQINKYAADANQ